jgi:hypothetical protein
VTTRLDRKSPPSPTFRDLFMAELQTWGDALAWAVARGDLATVGRLNEEMLALMVGGMAEARQYAAESQPRKNTKTKKPKKSSKS